MKEISMNAETVREQFSTFEIGGRTYGINVMKVQEVTKGLPVTDVPLAPVYVNGLINLRGQIATAISLRKLFGIEGEPPAEEMNVVCRVDGLLFSFLVDEIGDVVEVETADRESLPATVEGKVRTFLTGVYKLSDGILSVVDIERISAAINAGDGEVSDGTGK